MQGHGSKKMQRPAHIDLSGWHMKLLVNKLQGRQYTSQILVITRDVSLPRRLKHAPDMTAIATEASGALTAGHARPGPGNGKLRLRAGWAAGR